MCRSIKQLRQPEGLATPEEIQAAALQFVRKVSGYRVPSRQNREAFERAITEVAAATQRLLDDLEPSQRLSGASRQEPVTGHS